LAAVKRIHPRWLLLLVLVVVATPAQAERIVGVSWSNFQEERWKTDEAALREALEAGGARYLAADAQSSSEKQTADIESLLARGAEVLIVVAHDGQALVPALMMARAAGVPVIAYDRLIELPGIFYLSFDNREVGRIQARVILEQVPRGRYVFIKGSAQDPNSDFVHQGQLDVLGASIAAGEIQNVGEQYVDGWLPELAQRITEQLITANGAKIDAVVCSNDGMAGGVAAALSSAGIEGVPVSGQDGDHAALARVARGTQAVSVWKDARALGRRAAEVALALSAGASPSSFDDVVQWDHGPRGLAVDAILLEPLAITRERLGIVIDAGWVPKAVVCRGTEADPPPACAALPDAR
jgi:D-xylose transport system substrate-binding protein